MGHVPKVICNFRFSLQTLERLDELVRRFAEIECFPGFWQRHNRTSVLRALVNAKFEEMTAPPPPKKPSPKFSKEKFHKTKRKKP